MGNNLLVSVIIPAWNREALIGDALRSIVSQDYVPIEVLVVDDGSIDGTAEAAKAFGARVVRQEHSGIGAARNRGMEEARGELIAWLDSDDRWTPGSLMLRLEALRSDPELDLVFGHYVEFHDPSIDADRRARAIPGWVADTMVGRRASCTRVGRFEADLRLGEFVSWCARSREAGLRSLMLPDVVAERRVHVGNSVTVERASQTDYVRIVKAALDRQRSGGT